jgi:hypothetical protein
MTKVCAIHTARHPEEGQRPVSKYAPAVLACSETPAGGGGADLYAVLMRRRGVANGSPMRLGRTPPGLEKPSEGVLLDLVFLLAGLGAFVLLGAYAWALKGV